MPDSTSNLDTIQISLTRGQFATISAEDSDLADLKWYLDAYGYAERSFGSPPNRRNVKMHRVILARMLGREIEKNEFCDHINRNPSDNRRENLRISTRKQNQCNQAPRITNKSGYKGVIKRGNRWCASTRINGLNVHLGYFSTPEEAAYAYDDMVRKTQGDYAFLNFPNRLREA